MHNKVVLSLIAFAVISVGCSSSSPRLWLAACGKRAVSNAGGSRITVS